MTDQRLDLNDDLDAIETLRALVEQIRGSGFRDKYGQPIELNTKFCDAVALLELRGLTPEQKRPQPR